MRKINGTEPKEKSVPVTSRNTFDTNQIERLSGNSNGLSAFDSTQNSKDLQCEICNPPLHKPRGAMKFCQNCEAEAEQTATAFFDNFRRHRTVYKLNRYCFSCSEWKTEAVMSKQLQICRICAGELKTRGATARSNFIARTLNNFHKKLKGGATV